MSLIRPQPVHILNLLPLREAPKDGEHPAEQQRTE